MSRLFRLALVSCAALSLAATAAFADSGTIDGFTNSDIQITAVRNGQIVYVVSSGTELTSPLSKIQSLTLDNYPRFNDAEAAMAAKDYPKAADAYAAALQKVNDRTLRLVVEARSIPAFDNAGRWPEAVSSFLALYRASPTPGTFALRPTHLPAAGSALLASSATLVASQFNNTAFKSPKAQKSLKTMLLEIYNRMGDPRAAALAKELNAAAPETGTHAPGTGQTSPLAAPPRTANPPPAAVVATAVDDPMVKNVEAQLAAKKYDDVIKQADAALATATDEGAVHLFLAKAQALQALSKLPEAAAVYMRIPIHYPKSPAAAAAMLTAARIESQLQDDAAAKRLFKEVVDRFPGTPEAAAAAKNAS